MKTTQKIKTWAARLLGAVLLAGAITGQAQNTTTSVTNRFDAANTASGWTYWYDNYNNMYNSIILDWDGTVNDGGAAGSGTVLFTNLWAGHGPGFGQSQIWGTFAHTGGSQYDFSTSIDGTKYDTITFDVHVNADAPTNLNGNICRLTVGFFCNNFSIHGTTNVDIPTSATNGWFHVVAAVNKADGGLSTPAVAWALDITCYGGPNANLPSSPNPTYLWIDNIQANRAKAIAPPPTLSGKVKPAIPGLDLFLNNQYDRSSLKANATTGLGFLGQPDTTYFFTITNFPDAHIYPNNQAHIFLSSPDNAASSIDYNSPNIIWLNIQENNDGTATANFRYKIFEPGSNTNMFGANYTVGPQGTAWAGTLTNINASSPLGTWSMTFHQDTTVTNVTLIAPSGASVTITLDPFVASQFADPMAVVFGAQPNDAGTSTGQAVVFSEAGITNASGPLLDDQFLNDGGVLNVALWSISAANAADVQVFGNDPGQKLVNWTVPDSGFWLEVATNIDGPWFILTGSQAIAPLSVFSLGGDNVLVPTADLSPRNSFFRLNTFKFTKLQILMPGETATPGVAPGKTGTPDAQSSGNPFNVTVNSVDANWNPASYASDLDVIRITSSDTTATLPPDAQLIGGTGTFPVTLNTNGTFTVTASDITTPSRTADTGTPELIP